MGYKRSRKRDYRRNKGRARPKLAIVGAISLVIGALLIHYVGVPTIYNEGKFDDNPALIVGGIGVTGGIFMLLFSMSKRNQKRFVKGMDTARKMFEDECNCCKCTNCDRNHNHWTHD